MWRNLRRYALLPIIAAIMFSTGYATMSFAGSIFGRCYDTWNDGCGYFLNHVGSCPVSGRDDVMPGGISSSINSATEFIDAIESPLHGTNAQKKTGAAFIIQTMIGNGQGGTSSTRFNPPNSSQITDFEQRVRYAAAKGRIQYNKSFTYSLNTCYQGNATSNNDDMFWDENASGYGTQTGTGIKFLNSSGGVAYEIQWSCANPIGVISGIPDAPDYVITGRTTVSSPTVYPGGSVTFQNFLKDTGSSSASNINWTTKDGNTGTTIDSGTDSSIASNSEDDVSDEVVNVPANTPFSTQYCRYISFNPATYGYGSGSGSTVCTTVVPNFDITPTVTPSSATAQQNDLITFTYTIVNGGPTSTTTLTCAAAGQTNGSGYTPQGQQDSDRTPHLATQPTFNCNQQFPVGSTVVATETFDVSSTPIGSSICRSLVVNPKDDTGGYRAGAESCVVVAKAPYVQFMGNDVWAGGGFAAVNPLCNTASKIQTVSRALRDGTNA
ncbi:MAG TPA: hypothetical protein VNG90_02520, partial [Candidatus Acidoferrum sp.]|nr:hypothetical protein [Candidatus Acidoferrum sp.]